MDLQSATYPQPLPPATQPSSDRQAQSKCSSQAGDVSRQSSLAEEETHRPAQPVEEKSMLQALLEECHEAFSLEGERRETDLIQLPLILYRLQTAQWLPSNQMLATLKIFALQTTLYLGYPTSVNEEYFYLKTKKKSISTLWISFCSKQLALI